MDGVKRREAILLELESAEKPISASRFAQKFKVSRQIVVGDVALLRAAGYEIIATARGYLLEFEKDKEGIIRKIACQHMPNQTEDELMTIVSLGGEIIDVVVEHPIYGELTGGLHIRTEKEVKEFAESYKKRTASLLSELTGGLHLHTIRCENEDIFKQIKEDLAQKGILYNG
ncbi:transcriptional regulator [Enterococcus haemoperoxidus ATCC BAA-382]|uniref:Transcriptional regulator n=1 Tax=Enterococcus haemoperoxidus ATCC BAA-382 TaxID=1158608 RepID=R2SNZ1_9ENTE|nr:transcription repressor NadR [Enterococcus haemoperoxidus]EOH94571.1 transcriptional regulator [Enterococcus haemoperoxidus ATCC BAA-382]EOT60616.1 transcriptional regulator [Enterococcus haemoperoxidus ATCC BAA-382]OJG52821.1 transcriptional regulator [Enterococcus haemoperoxidus]